MLERKSGPIEFSIDRTGGDYKNIDVKTDPTGAVCGQACEAEQPLPRLDLCAAGLSRRLGALLPEGADDRAAPQAMLRVGRGAVTAGRRRSLNSQEHEIERG